MSPLQSVHDCTSIPVLRVCQACPWRIDTLPAIEDQVDQNGRATAFV